ncbi:putative reverse transcriptase domain-containing protein, partial [Tanacetum coccineum]
MAPSRRSSPSNNKNPDIATIIAQQLQTILPQIVTQVTNNVNNANANGGNGRNGMNNGCSCKTFMACNPKEYDGKGGAIALTRWIEKIASVFNNSGCAKNQRVKFAASSFVNKALTYNEMEKLENEFWNPKMVGANHAANTDQFHEFGKLVPHLVTPESSRIKENAILRAGILTDEAVSCGTLIKGNEKRNKVKKTSKLGWSWKDNKKAKVGTSFVSMAPPRNESVGSHPKAPGQAGNQWALEGNHNARNNGNPTRGRAFQYQCSRCSSGSKVMTGTFSLNEHFATVLFDSGADFSFISTNFAPLLNVKPSIVNPGCVIEVSNGKKVEVDRIIRDYKLELGDSLFIIDLIRLGHGSFDVIVGIDWLSKNKVVIVCHEKVVEIPL